MREKIKNVFSGMKNGLKNPKRRTALIAAVLSCVLILCTTFAWYYNQVTLQNSTYNTGTLEFEARGYNKDGEFITLITKEEDAPEGAENPVADGTKINQPLFSQTNAYAGSVCSSYITVENKGTLDFDYYVALTLGGTGENDKKYLGGYWYRLTNITNEVTAVGGDTSEAKIAAYALANQPVECTDESCVGGNHVCTENDPTLSKTNMSEMGKERSVFTLKNKDNTESEPYIHYYRLDLGLRKDCSTEEYTGLSFAVTTDIYATQVGAMSNDVSSKIHLVSDLQELEKAIRDSLSGDTIKLINDIEYNGDIVFNKCVSINTGRYTLKVNGNLIYNFSSDSSLSLDTSEGGCIKVLSTDGVGGDLRITAPNSAVSFIGSAANDDIVVQDRVTVKANYENGWVLSNVKLVDTDSAAKAVYIESNTKITVGSGVKLERIEANLNTSNVRIINSGEVNEIKLVNMVKISNQIGEQIYIQNYRKISRPIALPQWSEKYIPETGEGNTTIIKELGADFMDVSNKNADGFQNDDITDVQAGVYVEQIDGTDTALRLYLVQRDDTYAWGIKDTLDEYFFGDLSSRPTGAEYDAKCATTISLIKTLEIQTVGGKVLTADDFAFMHKYTLEDGTVKYYMPALENVDLTDAVAENGAIPASAFNGKTGLKQVLLPSNLTSVGAYAFYGTGVETVTVPASVTEIGNGAFAKDSYIYLKSYTPPTANISNLISSSYCQFVFVHENAYDDYVSAWSGKADYIYRNAELADDGVTFVRETDSGYEIVVYRGESTAITVGDGIVLDGNELTVTGVGQKAYIHTTNYENSDADGVNYLKNVKFAETVKYVSGKAFIRTKVASVDFVNVTDVAEYAFYSCTSLTDIEFGAVENISSNAFQLCTALTELTLTNVKNIGANAFASCGTLYYIEMPAVETLASKCFEQNSKLTVVKFGPNFVSCSSPFWYSAGIKEIYLTGTDTEGVSISSLVHNATPRIYVPYEAIDSYVSIFGSRAVITGKKVGNLVYTLMDANEVLAEFNFGEYEIYDLGNGEGILTSCNLSSISGDYQVPSVIDGKTVVSIGNSAYRFVEFENCVLSFPTQLREIRAYAFESINSASEQRDITGTLDLGNVVSIGARAFYNTGIKNISAPELVTASTSAFESCTQLETAEMPKVKTPGSRLFVNCSSLTSVYFETAVNAYINYTANRVFSGCTSLTSITINKILDASDAPNVGNAPAGTVIYVPLASMDYYTTGGGRTAFASYVIKPFGTEYKDPSTDVTYYLSEVNTNEYEIVAISTVSDTVVIPDSYNGYNITSIQMSAFSTAPSVTSVTLPAHYRTYVNGLFDEMAKISEINVSANNANFKSVDGVLFTKDGQELVCYPQAKADTAYTVPSGTEIIRACAFKNAANLTEITFNADLNVIGAGALDTVSEISKVTFTGTTPPYMGNNEVFDTSVDGFAIYVPAGSLSAYTAANGFIDCKDYITE